MSLTQIFLAITLSGCQHRCFWMMRGRTEGAYALQSGSLVIGYVDLWSIVMDLRDSGLARPPWRLCDDPALHDV